ncbi:hypothetical protein HDV57DRAFT_341253 [Trichoderma longibrachiatum]
MALQEDGYWILFFVSNGHLSTYTPGIQHDLLRQRHSTKEIFCLGTVLFLFDVYVPIYVLRKGSECCIVKRLTRMGTPYTNWDDLCSCMERFAVNHLLSGSGRWFGVPLV